MKGRITSSAQWAGRVDRPVRWWTWSLGYVDAAGHAHLAIGHGLSWAVAVDGLRKAWLRRLRDGAS